MTLVKANYIIMYVHSCQKLNIYFVNLVDNQSPPTIYGMAYIELYKKNRVVYNISKKNLSYSTDFVGLSTLHKKNNPDVDDDDDDDDDDDGDDDDDDDIY